MTPQANSRVAKFKKRLLNISKDILSTPYKALVGRHLEYANQTWNPHLKKYKVLIANIQRRATKLIPLLSGLSFSDGLKILNLPTLEFKKRRGNMIEIFKIVKGFFDPAVTEDILSVTERY